MAGKLAAYHYNKLEVVCMYNCSQLFRLKELRNQLCASKRNLDFSFLKLISLLPLFSVLVNQGEQLETMVSAEKYAVLGSAIQKMVVSLEFPQYISQSLVNVKLFFRLL